VPAQDSGWGSKCGPSPRPCSPLPHGAGVPATPLPGPDPRHGLTSLFSPPALHSEEGDGEVGRGHPPCLALTPLLSPQKRNRAITARRQHLKSVMLQIAATELEKEESRRESEKQNYLAEHCPPLHIPGSMSEVQELCKQLHAKIDEAEEEKYDMEVKVQKSTKELEDMNQK
ncbi:Troponin I, fast skeletal muscle, partial [Galemys pyrenaicus]